MRIKFSHLINSFDPAAHKMTDRMKKSSYTNFTFRYLSGYQCFVLPLKIVLRCGHKGEDLLKRAVNMCIDVNTDHLIFHNRDGYPHLKSPQAGQPRKKEPPAHNRVGGWGSTQIQLFLLNCYVQCTTLEIPQIGTSFVILNKP